jgi:WD40 repeat protein
LIKKVKDAHSRIIWGLSWSSDDSLFVTASREKQKSVKVWHGINSSEVGVPHSELPEGENPSATAVRFFPNRVRGCEALIVGLETGNINVWIRETEKWIRIF